MYFESKLVSAATCHVQDLSAVIYRSDSGGPVRMIINGRKSIPTDLYLSVKGGWRQMPRGIAGRRTRGDALRRVFERGNDASFAAAPFGDEGHKAGASVQVLSRPGMERDRRIAKKSAARVPFGHAVLHIEKGDAHRGIDQLRQLAFAFCNPDFGASPRAERHRIEPRKIRSRTR